MFSVFKELLNTEVRHTLDVESRQAGAAMLPRTDTTDEDETT